MMGWLGRTMLEVISIIVQVLLNTYLNCGPSSAGGWECNINQDCTLIPSPQDTDK